MSKNHFLFQILDRLIPRSVDLLCFLEMTFTGKYIHISSIISSYWLSSRLYTPYFLTLRPLIIAIWRIPELVLLPSFTPSFPNDWHAVAAGFPECLNHNDPLLTFFVSGGCEHCRNKKRASIDMFSATYTLITLEFILHDLGRL